MKFSQKLIEGVLFKRYKRFFADVEYVDERSKKKVQLTIHVPNTGSMKSILAQPPQNQKCWFSLSDDPARKLKGTLEAVQTLAGVWVGVNTSNPNRVVQEAIQNSIAAKIPFFKHWGAYKRYKSEHKISKESRLDGVFYNLDEDLLNPKAKKHFIEIKNTTLLTDVGGEPHAQFPDAVTERGQKHLIDLMNLIKEGHQAELIFTIQRNDARFFSVAKQIDSRYADLFAQAVDAGLIITPAVIDFDQHEISLSPKVLVVK